MEIKLKVEQNKPNINGTLKEQIVVYRESGKEPQNKSVEYVENGEYLVEPDQNRILEKVNIKVNVPIPTGYVKPEGNLDIKANGKYNIYDKESVFVNVPIPDDYIKPTGSLDIKENGIHNVTTYEKVNIDVPVGVFPEGTLDITSNGEHNVTNYEKVNVNIPDVMKDFAAKKVEQNSLNNLFQNMPIKSTDEYLSGIDTSKVTTMSQTFEGCANLTYANLNTDSVTMAYRLFATNYKLETVILSSIDKFATTMGLFMWCTSLKTLVIKNMTKLPAIDGSAFTQCCHMLGMYHAQYNPNSLKDGVIYIPDAFVEDAKTATNWSTLADNIKPLSEYVEE